MFRASLDQILAIHRAEGKFPLSISPKDGGEFEVEAVDVRTGTRLWREVHHNVMTSILSDNMENNYLFGNSGMGYVFVSNDEKPMNVRKSIFRATYATTPTNVPMTAACLSVTKNTASRTWTFTGTIPVPATGETRQYRTVGICDDAERILATNSHMSGSVIAATLLSEMKVQDELTLININYRLAWEEGHNV